MTPLYLERWQQENMAAVLWMHHQGQRLFLPLAPAGHAQRVAERPVGRPDSPAYLPIKVYELKACQIPGHELTLMATDYSKALREMSAAEKEAWLSHVQKPRYSSLYHYKYVRRKPKNKPRYIDHCVVRSEASSKLLCLAARKVFDYCIANLSNEQLNAISKVKFQEAA